MIKNLINADISKKLQVIMIIFMLIHVVYFAMFLYINKPYLSLINIFSVMLYAYLAYILRDQQMVEQVLIVTRVEIFVHALICGFTLGWDYGFQNIILALISVSFFTNSIGKTFGYVVAFLQGLAYLFLYLYFKDMHLGANSESEFIYIFNFVLVVCALVVFSSILRTFNATIYFNMLDRQEELEMAANKDPLTSLPNRRAFQNIMQSTVLETRTSVSIVMGDLDDFKSINDKFGHNAGDEVLKSVAHIIKTSLRKQDYVFRFGGEEFLILITDTSFENSKIVLNRIREKISQKEFRFNKEAAVKISVTFGFVYVAVSDNFDLNSAIKNADDLLNQGKREGKNCTKGEMLSCSLEFRPKNRYKIKFKDTP
ncbi:GGDEF domain-containing protein [Campylobacter sp.]|uniref:GGDEF domain-containing protein n=1 Tax=Campylobacter sp. TaxID=205 RepID=UPI0026FD26AD|nr:GGDEF domain-containing protein [Campylobacter sp.]